MADGNVLINSGQIVDSAELKRPDGTTVERQKIVLADGTDTLAEPPVERYLKLLIDEIKALRTELQITNLMLHGTCKPGDELDEMRAAIEG